MTLHALHNNVVHALESRLAHVIGNALGKDAGPVGGGKVGQQGIAKGVSIHHERARGALHLTLRDDERVLHRAGVVCVRKVARTVPQRANFHGSRVWVQHALNVANVLVVHCGLLGRVGLVLATNGIHERVVSHEGALVVPMRVAGVVQHLVLRQQCV